MAPPQNRSGARRFSLAAFTAAVAAATAAFFSNCGGASEPTYERVDVSARFGEAAAPFAIPSGGRVEASVPLPAGAALLLEARGAEAGSLEVELRRDGASLLSETLAVTAAGGEHEVDLGAVLPGDTLVRLSVPAGGPAVEVAAVALRVEQRPPNIILIIIDTLRADVLISKRKLVDTPNIDSIARDEQGVPFTHAFSHAPMTLPSHTALFSSRYPFENKVLNNGQTVPPDLPLFADHLSKLGYQTRAAVSLGTLWPNLTEDTALDRGFDVFLHAPGHVAPAWEVQEIIDQALEGVDPLQPLFFFAHYCDPHEPYNVHGVRDDGTPSFEATLSLDGEEIDTITTSDMTYFKREFELGPGKHRFELSSEFKSNVRILKVRRDGVSIPVSFVEGDEVLPLRSGTRRPLKQATFEFDGPEGGTATVEIDSWITDCPLGKTVPYRYFREVDYVDLEIGKLLDKLKARGLYENSIVLFTSDHGEALGEHRFQGHVENLYEEMLHIPLIFKLPAGSSDTEVLREKMTDVVRHVDVVPTLLDLAGLADLPGQRGLSLLREGDRTVIAETHSPEAKENQVMIRDADYKLIYYPDRGEGSFEMFALNDDPYELKNVFMTDGSKRPDWQDDLRLIAEISANAGIRLEDLSDDDRARMEAMGYFGGD
ncbi:MAG: sulfatase [Planctomycetota bacterium]